MLFRSSEYEAVSPSFFVPSSIPHMPWVACFSLCLRWRHLLLVASLGLAGGTGGWAQEGEKSSPPQKKVEWKISSDAAGGAKGAVVLPDGRILTTRTEMDGTGTQVVLSQSRDGGVTWENAAVICRAGPDVSLGGGQIGRAHV